MPRPSLPFRQLRSAVRRRRAADRDEDGFILMESIVAIGLITIILAALGGMTIRSVTATDQLRARQAAVQVATTTMAVVDSLPASDLISGRDASTVDLQWKRGLSNDVVKPALAGMAQTSDVLATTAGQGASAAVSTSTKSQTLNNIPYSIETYVGTCVIPSDTSTCVASGGSGVNYLRVVVAVTWSNRGCSTTGSTCTYVTSTLINTDADPVFNTNKATPPSTPVVTDPGSQRDTVGSTVSLQLAVKSGTGVPAYTWSVSSGALPAGLSMSTTGLISGTPTAVQSATPLTVTVTDAFLRTATGTFTWTIVAAPTVTTPPTQTSRVGVSTSLTIASTCPNSPCTFVLSGAPAGLSISAATGVISGTPTTPGTSSAVIVTITDADTVSVATTPFTWKVLAAGPTVGGAGTQGLTVGKAYSIPIPYTCPTPTCTITLYGGIPGLTLSTTDSASSGSTQFTTPGDVDTTGTTNLSAGKTTTQSSTAYSGAPSRAVDGNTDGVFNNGSVSHTNSQAQPWWQVDLGAASLVRAVRIWNRTDCCDTRLSNFYVFTSTTDMQSRTAAQLLADPTVTAQRVSGLGGQPNITIPAQSAARYVRVQLSGSDYLSLAEVQVLGNVDTGTSITVSATSGTVYATGTVPANAVPTGTSKVYTPSLTITDFTGTSATSATGSWTAFTPPTVGSPGTQTMSVNTSPNIPLAFTCPHVSCTLTLAGTVPGVGLSATSGRTTSNSTTSLALTGTSGTVYLNGLVSSSAVPSGTTRAYTPTVTISDSDQIGASASGSWTVDKNPHITNPGSQAVQPNQNVSLQMAFTCPNGGCSTWTATVLYENDPTWHAAPITSTGLYNPQNVYPGRYVVRITVTDSTGLTDTTTFTLNAQTFALNIPDQTTAKPTSGTTTVTLDASTLVSPTAGYTYTMSGAPAWLTLDPNTGILTATIASNSASDPSIIVTATSKASSTSTVSDPFAWTLQ